VRSASTPRYRYSASSDSPVEHHLSFTLGVLGAHLLQSSVSPQRIVTHVAEAANWSVRNGHDVLSFEKGYQIRLHARRVELNLIHDRFVSTVAKKVCDHL